MSMVFNFYSPTFVKYIIKYTYSIVFTFSTWFDPF